MMRVRRVLTVETSTGAPEPAPAGTGNVNESSAMSAPGAGLHSCRPTERHDAHLPLLPGRRGARLSRPDLDGLEESNRRKTRRSDAVPGFLDCVSIGLDVDGDRGPAR